MSSTVVREACCCLLSTTASSRCATHPEETLTAGKVLNNIIYIKTKSKRGFSCAYGEFISANSHRLWINVHFICAFLPKLFNYANNLYAYCPTVHTMSVCFKLSIGLFLLCIEFV